MCRMIGYFAQQDILLARLLVEPENSLINQSYPSVGGERHLNADGFGLAWYDFRFDYLPATFKSIQPAWNDNNLINLAKKISTPCFLSHVRASTIGEVNQSNCHPFILDKHAFVHNGTIRNFKVYKRALVDTLDEALFTEIKGSTDSECLFLLIMSFYKQSNDMPEAITRALQWVVDQQRSSQDYSRINIIITDGDAFFAVRFASKEMENLSLGYYRNLELIGNKTYIVSSEALFSGDDWHTIPNNHIMCGSRSSLDFTVRPLQVVEHQ